MFSQRMYVSVIDTQRNYKNFRLYQQSEIASQTIG